VIGGLMQNAITHTTTGVPGLQSLPVVGGLFRGKTDNVSKSELVIFITATIVAGQPTTGY
jgi:type II secretory pathway component GspD/PulD (secretin)